MCSNKHAFLIMVHNNSLTLYKCIQQIDSEFADIFIHVDLKCKNFNYERLKAVVKHSNLYFTTERVKVYWGSFSQIECEMLLLKYARRKGDYSYFHLISGQDLLLKPINIIYKECEESNSSIFLDYRPILLNTNESNDRYLSKGFYYRVSLKHYFVNQLSSRSLFVRQLCCVQNKITEIFEQRVLHQNIIQKYNLKPKGGANWFSLPLEVVDFILKRENQISKIFKRGRFVDEHFIQMIIGTDGRFDNSIVPNKRMVSFDSNNTGHPKIWTIDDYDKLVNSNCFFARKFDEDIDCEIIDKIFKHTLI
ncbi:beta-1,6-N-acetylglucosaminyltransferase [Limosilactobacillus fermentum]|uniref:beta-1,6-N-acetylglucosaminyltransferase n=1 Tax=Limosilactobacillus fermentum TaxID=1613 RepID=UPI0030CCAB70